MISHPSGENTENIEIHYLSLGVYASLKEQENRY